MENKDIILQYEEAAAKILGMNEKWIKTYHSKWQWLARLQRGRMGKKAWKVFKFFVDSKVENEAALTVNFLTDVANDMSVLDMLDLGYKKALKNGSEPILPFGKIGNDSEGQNIFDFMFYRWPVLSEID